MQNSLHRLATVALGVGALLLAALGRNGPAGPARAGSGWKLTWSDEFDGKEIDRARWDFDIGNGFYDYDANQWIGGWGNDELQYYTREPANAYVKDGMLHIQAVKESLHGCGYTSACTAIPPTCCGHIARCIERPAKDGNDEM